MGFPASVWGGPGGKELAFAGGVGSAVVRFPCCPGLVVPWQCLPFVGRAGEVVGGQDGSGGDGEELVIGHWELGPCQFALGFFEHGNVFRDARSDGVVPQHFSREVDEFAWVETPTVGVEVVEKLGRRDVGVQGLSVA